MVLSKGRKNYLIRYWNIGGNVEEPEDTAVAPSHLAADLISGDMAFVEGLLKVTVTVGAACYSMMMMMNWKRYCMTNLRCDLIVGSRCFF